MSMPVSRRQRSASFSTIEKSSAFDVESLTRDSATLNISLSLPPSLLGARLRPTKTVPERGWRRKTSSCLGHAWHQCTSWAWASSDGRATAAAVEDAVMSPLKYSVHDALAPASEDSQRRQQQQQQNQPSRHGNDSGKDWATGRGKGRGRGRGKYYWVRVKTVGCMCLAIIMAASIFNLFLAFLSVRAGDASLRRGGLISTITNGFFSPPRSPPRQTTEYSSGAVFPEGFPAPKARIKSSSPRRSYANKGSIGYPSVWDRVPANGNSLLFDENGASETGIEQVPSAVGKGLGIKQGVGPESMTAGVQLNGPPGSTGAVATAAVEVVARPIKFSTPEGSIWDNTPQSTVRPDPFDGQRVAVVVPYIGTDLPVWWDAFAEQARLNDGLIDWIIFCDQASQLFVPQRLPSR